MDIVARFAHNFYLRTKRNAGWKNFDFYCHAILLEEIKSMPFILVSAGSFRVLAVLCSTHTQKNGKKRLNKEEFSYPTSNQNQNMRFSNSLSRSDLKAENFLQFRFANNEKL